jgi:hypothetical protein
MEVEALNFNSIIVFSHSNWNMVSVSQEAFYKTIRGSIGGHVDVSWRDLFLEI